MDFEAFARLLHPYWCLQDRGNRSSRAQCVDLWKRVLKLPLSDRDVADLVHCCGLYGFAVELRRSHRSSGMADGEKQLRIRARQIAKEARDLETSISYVAKDTRLSILLRDAFFQYDNISGPSPRFPGLGGTLQELARAIEDCVSSYRETQVQIALRVRRGAMLGEPRMGMGGMTQLARSGHGRIDWQLLALLVNRLSVSQVDAASLKTDFKDLKKKR